LASQYIPSLAIFVINNKHQFTTNSEIHNKNTRQLNNFHPPRPNLSKCLKGISHLGIMVYNNLSSCIKGKIDKQKSFKISLKNFSLVHCFYSVEEVFFKTNLLKVLRFTQPPIGIYQLLKLFKFHAYKHLVFLRVVLLRTAV
jgi:hypothetical protein